MSTTNTTSTHASTRLPYFVSDRAENHSPRQLYDRLQMNPGSDPHLADTLRDCVVDKVSYYRKEGRRGGAHEIVVARFICVNENGTSSIPLITTSGSSVASTTSTYPKTAPFLPSSTTSRRVHGVQDRRCR
ncbi:hypothetical protein BD626DRAFT_261611 [Schizophyllum amplum]|uniref:Uncharacterized protein n=1 Tax=Schizophyllum amplum TaxID=97359 RepID=A0A550CGB7_9AGAR|nr:hypothetical protein BD626DRAFT_261611 [Auriculariopsis ampla]